MDKTVLIVDDDKLIRQGIVVALKEAGLHTIEANNGREGLEIATKGHIDMIVTDVEMPDMDGLTMIHTLRSEEHDKKVPVIVLSVHEDAAALNEALSTGVTVYLSKSTTSPGIIADQVLATLRSNDQ